MSRQSKDAIKGLACVDCGGAVAGTFDGRCLNPECERYHHGPPPVEPYVHGAAEAVEGTTQNIFRTLAKYWTRWNKSGWPDCLKKDLDEVTDLAKAERLFRLIVDEDV